METRSNHVLVGSVVLALLAGLLLFVVWLAGLSNVQKQCFDVYFQQGVGGLNKGGKSYYALDITNPSSPVMLWEFTDDNMGLTYGNPIISKRADGTWVVAVASGYNNSTGDGKGHLDLPRMQRGGFAGGFFAIPIFTFFLSRGAR